VVQVDPRPSRKSPKKERVDSAYHGNASPCWSEGAFPLAERWPEINVTALRERLVVDSTTSIAAVAAWRLMNEMLDIASKRAEEFLVAVLDRVAGDEAAESEVRDPSALGRLVAEGQAVAESHTKHLQ
jgi:hypothetical protein